MKNENFKKRLALALVPILSLTAVIGNVPILPTSVFAVTQDEVYIEEPMVIEEETLEVEEPAVIEEETLEVEEPAVIVEETEEVEEPAVIVEETEEVEEPEALLNEVPEDLQNLSVVNKDVLNANATWTIKDAAGDSKLEYKVGTESYKVANESTTFDFGSIGDTDGVTFKVTNGTNKQVKTFTYTAAGNTVPITLTAAGEATIANAIAKTITAINLEFEPAYTISWEAVTGGTLKIGTDEVSPYTSNGTQITATITPAAGKQVKTFTVGGVDKKTQLASNAYKFTPSADTEILVEFEPAYTISWTVGTGGTLKIGTDEASPYTSNGTQITATITPPAGKGIKTFTVTGDTEAMKHLTGTGPYSYTFTPTDNMTLAVTFDNKYDITWSVVGAGSSLSVNDDTDGTYAYINGEGEVTVKFTEAEGYVLTEFKVGTSNQTTAVKDGKYKFTPTKATALSAKFETIVCSIKNGATTTNFASLTAAIAYINANGSATTDYTIDILNNIPSLALTLPAATKAKSITLKTAKAGDAQATVAISNTTLAIPTELILDNVVLTNSTGVNLTLSATASALTVQAGGGIDKVVNVTTAADKVITLEDTTKFAITGNLAGKPKIITKGNLEIAGTVAIGELTYAADATVDLKKAEAAASTIGKIVVGNFATVLKSSKLSLTIGDIDASAAAADKGLSIKAIELGSKKYPVFKITGEVKKGTDPVSLTLYTDNKYDTAATIDPTTAIITSVKTTTPAAAGDTTGAMFKTSNKNGTKDYAFYKDGTSLKLGNNFVEVLDGTTHKENFIRLQDALDYINTNKAALTTTVIKVSGDMPSHGALTFPEEDITIQSKEPTGADPQAQYKVLFTGSVKLNANLTLKHIELSNSNIKGIAFDLNGKNLTLDTDSKVIFNNIVDTTKVTGTDTKASALNIKDAADLSFLGNINAIGNVNIEDNVIFKGAVANVELIDLKAAKYAYFRGGAITNKLKYVSNAKIYLQTTEKGAISKNITIKATEGAVTGTGKLKVNAVIDELTAAKDGLPEKITIKTAGGVSEKVIPGAVIVKLFKDSDAKAASFVTDAKNFKLTTDQTLITTKAGNSIKIAAPKLKLKNTTASAQYEEDFVTIEEALGVELSGETYTITITDNIVGADLSNIPAKVTVITAALPTGTDPLLKVVTAKDIGLNGDLTIENLNILAAAKTIGTVKTGAGENPTTSYKNAHDELVLANASLTVSEAYLDGLTLTGLDENDKIVGSSNVTFKKTGYIGSLMLESGTTAGKIGSIPEESKLPVGP